METSKYNELVDELAMLVIYALEDHEAYRHEELNQEDADKWFDIDRGDDVYFELVDGVWVANIYKEEMDKEHSEKWGTNEKDKK